MELLFRERSADEVEQEVTQRDQFNTDEVGLAATLVREPHQNSLDARIDDKTPVRTRITLVEPDPANEQIFLDLFQPLVPHLTACNVDLTDVKLGMPRCLLIEDFGTTGLLGDWSNVDDIGSFNDFWRRIGKSHKSGVSGGRWGLGKLVYSSSSKIRTFFGLTVRSEGPNTPLLMGQSVLATHKIGNRRFAPHGFYANRGDQNLQIPCVSTELVAHYSRAFGFSRTDESGLSIAIPFILDEITYELMIPEITRNYFFPILTGQLEVDVGGEQITAKTFDSVVARYSGAQFADSDLIKFIRELHALRGKMPEILLESSWPTDMEAAFPPGTLEEMRHLFMVGRGLVRVRAPIVLRRKDGSDLTTHFDLFLKRARDGARGDAIYVRGAITVPDESRYFRAHQALGALIAADGSMVSFLGDAENPAHTRWNGAAEKLAANWKGGKSRLSEIRNSLNGLYRALARAVETEEKDALIDVLSIKDSKGAAGKPRSVEKPTIPKIPIKPKLFRIQPRKGGFSVRGADGLTSDQLPLSLKVRVAYDILRGNPFKRHSRFDFDFTVGDTTQSCVGASCVVIGPNELRIEAQESGFHVDVQGFDSNRDLMIRVTR